MKKSKLLILFPVMGLFLSGCTFQEGLQSTKSWIKSHIYQPLKSFFGSSSTPSEEGKKDEGGKEQPKDEGKTFTFEEAVKAYADDGFTGVEVPAYKCASADASITQPYPEDMPYYYVIKGSSKAEMDAFAKSFNSKWDVEQDKYKDYSCYFGEEPDEGESCPKVYVGDYTSLTQAGIVVWLDYYTTPYSTVPNSVISTDVGVTAALPEFSGTKYGYYYSDADSDLGSCLEILVDYDAEAAGVTSYQEDLLTANFIEQEQDGAKFYIAPSYEYYVYVFVLADYFPGEVLVSITALQE